MCNEFTREGTQIMTTSSPAANLNEEQLLAVLTALKNGDFSQRMPTGATGTAGQIAETLNSLLDQLGGFEAETKRITREIGKEGRFGGQADVPGLSGSWKEMVDSLNMAAGNLTGQIRNIARTITYIATGDLAKKADVDARGEILELRDTINLMVDQLNNFASEVTRIAREAGTEGKFGGQAEVKGITNTWRDLLDNVNFMAASLTDQVRDISSVVHAVSRGDLSRKVTIRARGETQELKDMINAMIDQVRLLADEFRRISREIGTEGRFGGQAEIPGLSGTWNDLVIDFNRMAEMLTIQVRDLSQTAQALVAGDTSRKVTVPAAGETVQLKNAVNTLVEQHSHSRR
jgi:HAMP domain-containing protein